MRPHQGSVEGKENLPRPAAHTSSHTASGSASQLGILATGTSSVMGKRAVGRGQTPSAEPGAGSGCHGGVCRQLRSPWLPRGSQELHGSTTWAVGQTHRAVIRHPLLAKAFKFSHLKGELHQNCCINAAMLYIIQYLHMPCICCTIIVSYIHVTPYQIIPHKAGGF